MRTISSPYVLAAALLAFSPLSHAQTTLSPSGNYVDYDLAGWQVTNAPPSATNDYETRWASPQNTGDSVSYDASFFAPSGYTVADGWQGSFSVGATKLSGPDGNNGYFYHLSTPLQFNSTPSAEFIGATGNLMSSGAYEFNYGPGANAVEVTYDFSGLTYGYLPAGTVFFVPDFDAFGAEGPMTISASLAAGSGQYLDYIWAGQLRDSAALVYPPTVTWNGTDTYTLTQQDLGYNNQWDGSVFVTTQDITTLTVLSSNSTGSSHDFHIAGQVAVVPEPSGALLMGLTGALALFRRKRAN